MKKNTWGKCPAAVGEGRNCMGFVEGQCSLCFLGIACEYTVSLASLDFVEMSHPHYYFSGGKNIFGVFVGCYSSL